MRVALGRWVWLFVALAPACSLPGVIEVDDAASLDVSLDAMDDSSVDAVGMCPASTADCDRMGANGCEVNTAADPNNCGGCGVRCPMRSNSEALCVNGMCDIECTAGFNNCDGNSSNGCEIDIRSNTANCGSCMNACASGQICSERTCACPTGLSACLGRCVNFMTDTTNCGACGTRCPSPQICAAGTCAAACTPAPRRMCGAACVDTSLDAMNCGMCAQTCALNQVCRSSVCACATGYSSCAGACVNLQTNSAHCGVCGRACATLATCNSGSCVCSRGYTECSGACVNTLTDERHCGGCGRPCALFNYCSTGVCRPTFIFTG